MDADNLEFQPSEEDLKNLREWIAKSPHIVQDYDDTVLSAFVRGCKGSLQKTKKILEGLNSLGQRYFNIMKNYDPLDQRLVDHLSQAMLFMLPKKTPDGSAVYFAAFRDYEGFQSDPYRAHITDLLRYAVFSLYIYFWTNDFGPGKIIMIVDCKAVTITNGRELTPVLVKQWIEMLQNALPIRMQAIHIINIPTFLEYICNFAKSLAKKKLAERMYFHSTTKTFYDKFPKEILPKEYGGNEDSAAMLHDRWYKTVVSFRKEFLEEESKMRKLDPLRPKMDYAEEMVGTFKKLNVD